MGSRLELQATLEDILESRQVFFQPPRNLQVFPAIIYEPDAEERTNADNQVYGIVDRYQVTLLDQEPDSLVRHKLRLLPMTSFNRWFAIEGLNHFIYTIYF